MAPMIETPEIIKATIKTNTCWERCKSTNFFDSLGILIGSAGTLSFAESITTWRAPTTTVALTNAEITPTASAIPNVSKGGSGDMMFAKNAATVVITARPSGVDNLPQDASHASDESPISPLNELYLRWRCIE